LPIAKSPLLNSLRAFTPPESIVKLLTLVLLSNSANWPLIAAVSSQTLLELPSNMAMFVFNPAVACA
jgi:hypothetical protein